MVLPAARLCHGMGGSAIHGARCALSRDITSAGRKFYSDAARLRTTSCGPRLVALCELNHFHCYSTHSGQRKSRDLYTIMGMSPHATQQQIKDAYYKLSMKYHPDRNKGSPDAHRRFTELTEAYSILGNYEKRRKYDKGLLHIYPTKPHPHQRPEHMKKTTVHGEKVKFNFDEFYRAHYGEALKREQQNIRKKKEAKERASLKTLSNTTQRLMIMSVTLSVFIVGWYWTTGHMRRKSRTLTQT